MKKIFYNTAIAAFAAFAFCSCEDYLDKTPLDSNSDATNWTSEASIEQFSWKFYGYLSELSYGSGSGKGQYHAESLTDDYATESFTEFTKNIPNSASAWNNPYDRIREANIMLNRIDLVNMPEAAKNHWKGVAKFFRGLYHFQLVKTYGDVVWVDDEIDFSKEENVTKPRDSRVTVMDNVVADLKFAADNCYAPSVAGKNTVNNMVANALLSRAALYEGAWEKYHKLNGGHPETFYTAAKDAAKKVIDSGLYAIGDDYKKMYTSLSLADSKEVILFKVYTLANVNGGKVTAAHSQYGWVDSSTPTWGLTKSAMENYTNAAGLPIHMDPDYNDKTMAGVFENRDKRLNATVYDQILPVVQLAYSYKLLQGILSTTGFWTNKFLDMNWLVTDEKGNYVNNPNIAQTWNMPSNDTDGPIFQYSEVLENYAEACAELGAITQNDLDISVNILRTKHGKIPALTLVGKDAVSVNGVAITMAPNDPAANVLIQELRRDRRSELMADGFRHDDLMRWALGANLDTKKNPDGYVGASVDAIKDYTEKAGISVSWADVLEKNFFANGYKSPYNTSAVNHGGAMVDRTWDDKYYLEPIPSGQILLDNNLEQNPGWK